MASMTDPSDYIVSITELDTDACWRLIGRGRIGRLGYILDGQPRVLPVNTGVLDRQVVFRTSGESTLGRLVEGSDVTFECDHTDPAAESGWSVVVRGRLSAVVDSTELARLAESELHPWAPGVKDRWMKITPTEVTGRVVKRRLRPEPGVRVPSMPPN
jgi:nitroimidazol reductase NimA-like FMN-containing flavoprotein (pyridoxamine 5'-phosphate oxidase superfamily)